MPLTRPALDPASTSPRSTSGYPELFAISLAEPLFLRMGFHESTILRYPEKIARYRAISRSELSIGRKFCFAKKLTSVPAAG